jgi:hypothetical protein
LSRKTKLTFPAKGKLRHHNNEEVTLLSSCRIGGIPAFKIRDADGKEYQYRQDAVMVVKSDG